MAQEQLRTYYNYLYPFHTLVNWLTHNNHTLLAHRQLSFEYEGVGVQRYVVFNDAEAMKQRMIDQKYKTPLKVDAGAVWNRVPQKDTPGKTVQRQLVFDFDMNDYDDVRTCCVGKTVCSKCWKLLVSAVQVIERALAEDFDFHQLMFVFSGGRGLHIWVCDKRARQLKDTVRKSIIDYLQLVTGNDKAASLLSDRVIGMVEDNKIWRTKGLDLASRDQIKKFYLKYCTSAHVERSLQIIANDFLEIMGDQKVFQHQKCVNIMLKVIQTRNQKLRNRISQKWTAFKDKTQVREMFIEMIKEIERFEMTQTVEDYNAGRMPDNKVYRITFIEEEIMLSFLYPRMDYNVSTMQNHLLKLPFSVHPSSKKISIPLFKRQLKDFNPARCVTIGELLKDLDYSNLVDLNQTNAKKSLLRQPIEALQQFTINLN